MDQFFSRGFRSGAVAFLLLLSFSLTAQPADPALFNAMQWRMIGPFRGGRTVGAAGVAQQPNVFYIGVNNGGVWKTTDYGHTWQPVFDGEATGSIGTVSVAPSNPSIIYVGSGEGLHRPDLSVGNGIYKSTDAGKTWAHLGLQEGQQIPKIAVDPHNPDRLFVAVLGHPYGPNPERGIYRSVNGGQSFERVLYIDENTGGDDVVIDPSDPNTIYATCWESREGPWENAAWADTKGGVFKSTDGGNTWHKIMQGLPANLVQAHISVAPSNTNKLYLVIATSEPNQYGTGTGMGMFRSDNKGETWQKISDDGRPEARIGGGDLPEMAVDPNDPETIYSASIVLWKSTDGGQHWTGIRGAPGGDDYQNIWINPLHPHIMLVTGDQGAIVTVNGGATWSSWYNQPTAQLYHVSADNDFPYNVYSGQQESGSVGIASRGNDGAITFRNWHPVGAQEYGYVAPDPLNSDIVYGGKLSKYNKRTGQVQHIAPSAPPGVHYRFVRTAPLLFSPVDPRTLFYAGNVLFKTRDGGRTWQVMSPDLTRDHYDVPASVGTYATDQMATMPRRGVIYTVAPSYRDSNTIWCGTDDGLIQLTHDGGKHWQNVTPSSITSWSKLSIMDAGHFDTHTAYAAVNRIRCDDMHPYIYRTHDDGRTWQKIVTGLPDDPINVVREDPVRKGLLYAGSETAVYVSFDDGNHWQSLRLNMPASSIRDLIIKNDDIVVATHGRSFWILDAITPLRQIAVTGKTAGVVLYKPATTWRVRWNNNTDTPLPPEEPAGQNPPDGAPIDYYLNKKSDKEVKLEILDAHGRLVRKYSSFDQPYDTPRVNVPLYWLRPQQILSGEAGSHRFVWDLHYTPLDLPPSFPIAAIYENTAPNPTGPWVMPGTYTVRLTVDGKSYTQPITIKMDPRVRTGKAQLQLQHDLSLQCYEGRKKWLSIQQSLTGLHHRIDSLTALAGPALSARLKALDTLARDFADKKVGNAPGASQCYGQLSGAYGGLQESDMTPAPRVVKTARTAIEQWQEVMKRWALLRTETSRVNAALREAKLPLLSL